jgi:hypothetical protein
MNRWFGFLTIVAICTGVVGNSSRAGETVVTVPADAKFVVQFDIQACRGTSLGAKLIEFAKKQAEKGLADDGLKGKDAGLEKLHEVIGFDPLQEIKAVLISGSDFEHPEKSVVMSVKMGKTTGNLEGLLLGLPGYAAQEHSKYTIHSVAPDDNLHVYGAIHTDGKGDKTILFATQRETVCQRLDTLDGKASTGSELKNLILPTEGTPFLTVDVLEIPAELIGKGPQSGVAKIVQSLGVRLSEAQENLNIAIWLNAGTEQQSEQLRQMAQGLIALLSFAQSMDPDDEDLQKFQKMAKDIQVARDGLTVKITLNVPSEQLNELINEHLDDH